jgi:hypothetical protein
MKKAYECSHHRFAKAFRHSLHDGVTAYSALSLVIGLFVTIIGSMRQHRRQLDVSVETSGPHGFSVRKQTPLVGRRVHVHRIPRYPRW